MALPPIQPSPFLLIPSPPYQSSSTNVIVLIYNLELKYKKDRLTKLTNLNFILLFKKTHQKFQTLNMKKS